MKSYMEMLFIVRTAPQELSLAKRSKAMAAEITDILFTQQHQELAPPAAAA